MDFLRPTGRNCIASLVFFLGQAILGCWLRRRKKMHDCGLEVFMLKWLVSAHLIVLSVLITVWSITPVGFRRLFVLPGSGVFM